MKSSRRGFLKFAGISAVGVAGSAAVTTTASGTGEHEPPKTEGKRLALVVDLRKFSKDDALLEKCIDACHTAHSVPNFADDPKNEVKWIWKEGFGEALPEQESPYLAAHLEHGQVLVFCNHCDNPPCTRVCPTQATWKRAEDGVVMMDWHRCIGCRYCVVACPYGARLARSSLLKAMISSRRCSLIRVRSRVRERTISSRLRRFSSNSCSSAFLWWMSIIMPNLEMLPSV
mgnify:CR=1 FL=1